MNKKIKLLFVSQHVVNNSTFQAGHKSFGYYLSRFCNDEAFDVGFLVDHNEDPAYLEMKSVFHQAHDFSVSTPKFIRKLKYIFYNSFLKHLLSAIDPTWLFLNPFRSYVYKKGLTQISKSNWTPDVIAFEWTEVVFLNEFCRKLFPIAKMMATEHDVSFKKLYRQYESNIYIRTLVLDRFRTRELQSLINLDLVIVLSQNDLEILVENSVDRDKILLLTPFYNRTNQKQENLKPTIIFYGAMKRPENLEAVSWFIDNVFIPFQLDKIVSLTVVGSGVPDEIIKRYKDVEKVNFTGFVEYPEEYFKSALCMIVPLTYGGGIKIKVLEAMSAGVTVLTNDIGIEGIKAESGKSYIHCTEPSDYYNAIKNLRADFGLAYTIGEAGRLMMESNYNFEEGYKEYSKRLSQL